MIVTVMWDVMLCCLVDKFQHFGGPAVSIFSEKELKGGPGSWRH
jgi:hypothetical protein